jgi:hypothetical protein
MTFIQEMRANPQLMPEGVGEDLVKIVGLGARMGYNFTADDLRAAFRHDWQLRWQRFCVAARG